MQNEPNLLETKINLTSVKTKNYGNFRRLQRPKNEPNLRQIKPNLSRRSLWRRRIKPNFTRYKFYLQTTDTPISLVNQLNTCIFAAVLVNSGKINGLYQKRSLER